jgi:site-specific recombinase XerD
MKNSLSNYLNTYFNSYLSIQKNLSKHTISSYRYTFNGFLGFCINEKHINIKNISLDTFNKDIVIEFLDYLENVKLNSISTRNNRFQNICSFLKFVYPNESTRILQFQNIFDIPLKKDIEKPMEYMTVDVLKILLKQPNTSTINGRRDLTLLATLYDTGARVSELINLKVRDVKFNDFTTTVKLFGKGSKIRVVPIIGNTAELLKIYIKEHNLATKYDNYLFVSNLKKPLTEPGIKYIIEKYRKLATKESSLIPQNIHPHMFRHSKAMHLLESGVNYVYIRDFLGHSDIKTTEIYAKISVEQKKKALSNVYQENIPISEQTSWNKDRDLLNYLMQL